MGSYHHIVDDPAETRTFLNKDVFSGEVNKRDGSILNMDLSPFLDLGPNFLVEIRR